MNDAEFEGAVRQHSDRVHRHAIWVLQDREEARDVAQEALVSLWKHRTEVVEPAARSWLLRTTYRLCLDRLRRRRALAEVGGESTVPVLPDPAPGPERAAASARLGDHLERALSTLPARDRAVVLLREVEGLPYDEIARALDLPLGTLKALLHRSRERLRVALVREGVRP